MAKQFIISAMEETLGEYILNISKENLKIAALRGQIKLENVQLDGDLVGSHVLGAVGLSSFGVLSCSAKSIKVSIPWKNLEKEPTRFEIKGVHLVCVPLTPSTANQMYGAGTLLDPRCTLRTRAKRLVLSRFERNFWNGQISGEGPVMKRIQRAVKDVERDWKKTNQSSSTSSSTSSPNKVASNKTKRHKGYSAEEAAMNDLLDNLVLTLGMDDASESQDTCLSSTINTNESINAASTASQDCADHQVRRKSGSHNGSTTTGTNATGNTTNGEADYIPELPRDWKVRLREKILRNMEANFQDIHIRLEVPERGLEFAGSTGNTATNESSAERAFALGFTMERVVVRTANYQWEAGSHEKRNNRGAEGRPNGTSQTSQSSGATKDHLGPNEYVSFNNKIGHFHKLSVYWDDDPPILLSETDAMQGNYRKLTSDKLQARVAAAMEALFTSQEPGSAVRQSLSAVASSDEPIHLPHCYICESLNAKVRVRTSDRTLPGPISCSADVLPFSFTFNLRPNQYMQYQKLKSAVKSQQRLDTMPRQRPFASPLESPQAWWKYAIACVTSRPDSRPWHDVKRIGQCRRRYIELVMKKNMERSGGIGFHAGMSAKHSAELLMMEDALPIEALLAFHLVALRRVHECNQRVNASRVSFKADISPGVPNAKMKSKNTGRFRLLPRRKKPILAGTDHDTESTQTLTTLSTGPQHQDVFEDQSAVTTMSLLHAMTLRLGKKVWIVDWKLYDAEICTVFVRERDDAPMLKFILRASGNLRSFGLGKRDFAFDITQCDITHDKDIVLFVGCPESDVMVEEGVTVPFSAESLGSLTGQVKLPTVLSSEASGPDLVTPSTFLELPPKGTVCRAVAGKDQDTFKLSISAHPATLVWTPTLSDSIAEFSADQSSDLQLDITQHIRNAATPLARKAQLALLSPASLSFHLNIEAPKVWVPLVSNNSEGTGSLFLDAGTLRMASSKEEGDTEVHWKFVACDIGANFVRGFNSSRLGSERHLHKRANGNTTFYRGETSVVRPFSIDASSQILRDLPSAEEVPFADPIRNVEVAVSPICLNLVDAEMLARFLGKLYARGLHRVRRQVLNEGNTKPISTPELPEVDFRLTLEELRRSELPRILTVKIEKIEIALEGHSKQMSMSDERSLASLDTALQEYAPPTRAYLAEVFQIVLKKSSLGHTEITRLCVADASIVRLRDVSLYSPMMARLDEVNSEYCILVRSSEKSTAEGNQRVEVFRAALLHNRVAHLDEVEVDIDSVVLRVTPTTLKDCAKAFRRIMELTQLVTKEMERKVHEEGRKARRRVRESEHSLMGHSLMGGLNASLVDRPASPAFSEAMTELTISERKPPTTLFDSSILFKLTLHESTLLAGRPMSSASTSVPAGTSPSYAVIQVLSNALIMFQSIENPDATGTKTLHISVDNVSALVNTEFERVSPTQAPPAMEPTGAEFRVVYSTENFGCVVSQDVSFDCDSVKSCLTPNDIYILITITRSLYERLRAFGAEYSDDNKSGAMRSAFSSLIRYQKKGTGIATRIRSEIQTMSFVLLRAYKSHFGAPDFLDFNIKHVKGMFEGCVSALSGECSALVAINSFNSEVADWEYAVEPFSVNVGLEQMPNELVLHIAPACQVQLNLSGILLRDFAEMLFDIKRNRPTGEAVYSTDLAPSVLSTVGLRRASEAPTITVSNSTGIDIHVVTTAAAFATQAGFVSSGTTSRLEGISMVGVNSSDLSLYLRIAASAVSVIGERKPVLSLPLLSEGNKPRILLLKPASSLIDVHPGRTELLRLLDGRASPESMLSEGPFMDEAYYDAEPIVEWCMQNQRLRSSIVDSFSLPKGQDLLSSNVWTLEDDVSHDTTTHAFEDMSREVSVATNDGPEAAAGVTRQRPVSPERGTTGRANVSKWLRPYLKNDAPEWSDMTCKINLARERIMLPDSKWIWVNDWNVDLNGVVGTETDADGWSYEASFENFSSTKRHYLRGDACRRRRWIRTRMIRPPKFDDPLRQIIFVWETRKDANGCIAVTVRGHIRIHNSTNSRLSFFLFTPSWEEDKLAGTAKAAEVVDVPVAYGSAVYMRIARNAGVHEPTSVHECVVTDRFSIVPTSYTSSTFTRTRMNLEDVSGTTLHFLVEFKCEKGILDIFIHPIVRLVNLLPCQLECRVGQIYRERSELTVSQNAGVSNTVTKTETLTLQSGSEGAYTAINPWRKPHISLRVPGYKWSNWQQVVNKRSDSTWRPPESEEEFIFNSKGDLDSEEFKTLVRFERKGGRGDPLILMLSVACGHCPTLRVYSQYWIVDKTGFGCRFSEGFTDMLRTIPDPDTSRRSYLTKEEAEDPELATDLTIPGHQWSIGSSGITLYFSQRERLTLVIETGIDLNSKNTKNSKSNWIAPLDISNVIPKTVFTVDECNGPRRFELAIHVTLCSGAFARTKMISILPRYQIINLLHRELVIAQDGCLDAETVIPSQSSISFHWEKGSMLSQVRLGAPSTDERARGNYSRCWTNGRLRLDRIGITSLRLPTTNTLVKVPMVVQAEVRLATKGQSSAVVVVVWSGSDKTNPLYMLRNRSQHTILCRQPLQDEDNDLSGPDGDMTRLDTCSGQVSVRSPFECGVDLGPTLRSFLGLDRVEEFVWILKPGSVTCFGFDDPEKPHILEWTYVNSRKSHFDKRLKKAILEVDAMGSFSLLTLPGGPQVRCQIRAEHSTKVIEFAEVGVPDRSDCLMTINAMNSLRQPGMHFQNMLSFDERGHGDRGDTSDDDEAVLFSLRIEIPALSISVVDNADPQINGREILLAQFEKMFLLFSQTREGYHEFEAKLMGFQVDNHVEKSIHPVLIFCPRRDEREPLLHMSAIRRLPVAQMSSSTFAFRYAAIRLLEVEIYLDRRTAETIARFIQPLLMLREEGNDESPAWVSSLTLEMAASFARPDRRTPRSLKNKSQMANNSRIYVEQLHLHPVRLGLTFTQEWMMDSIGGSDTVMVFQFIRGMASIANAPLTFTSFVVAHVFESPQELFRVVTTHYSSQLTKQVFGILGSLAILGAPADFISNVGNGVKDFLYEPLQGAALGPKEFLEGLEAGTQSLARGLFVGVVRGAANVTDAVNSNLAGFTADDDFMDERKAYQRMLTDAMSRGASSRSFVESLNLAYASLARGVKSGALGIVEQPAIYASKHGPVGFLKGVGKAVVGAVVKPVVGLGDGAVLVMNHMSDATSKKQKFSKIPKRLRRALPSYGFQNRNCVRLEPFDERAAKAQKIVTGGESVQDIYLGHVNISSHLIIASEQCLWAIDRRSREPWCVNWEEISHFGVTEGVVRIVVFSQTGLKSYFFQVENARSVAKIHQLLSMQLRKMANVSELNSSLLTAGTNSLSGQQTPGVKAQQVHHIFGSCNNSRKRVGVVVDEVDLVEQCRNRVRKMDSSSSTFCKSLDEEAWSLVYSLGQLFSGLSSRRCIVACVINGSGHPIQIKSAKLFEGESLCHLLTTREYDACQGVLMPGGVIVLFGWGVVPNLLQPGSVFMHVDTNGFVCNLTDQKSSATDATAMPGYQVGFLEKSYDDSGWWAKYWLLVRSSDGVLATTVP